MKYLFGLLLVGLLISCSSPTIEELQNDPELLDKVFNECQKMSSEAAQADEGCRNANTIVTRKRMERQRDAEELRKSVEASRNALLNTNLQ